MSLRILLPLSVGVLLLSLVGQQVPQSKTTCIFYVFRNISHLTCSMVTDGSFSTTQYRGNTLCIHNRSTCVGSARTMFTPIEGTNITVAATGSIPTLIVVVYGSSTGQLYYASANSAEFWLDLDDNSFSLNNNKTSFKSFPGFDTETPSGKYLYGTCVNKSGSYWCDITISDPAPRFKFCSTCPEHANFSDLGFLNVTQSSTNQHVVLSFGLNSSTLNVTVVFPDGEEALLYYEVPCESNPTLGTSSSIEQSTSTGTTPSSVTSDSNGSRQVLASTVWWNIVGFTLWVCCKETLNSLLFYFSTIMTTF